MIADLSTKRLRNLKILGLNDYANMLTWLIFSVVISVYYSVAINLILYWNTIADFALTIAIVLVYGCTMFGSSHFIASMIVQLGITQSSTLVIFILQIWTYLIYAIVPFCFDSENSFW